MNTSIVRDLLLFDFPQWTSYAEVIISFCRHAIYPIFIFSLLFDKASISQEPIQILKRLIIAQLIIISLPSYFPKVAGFGFSVADSVMRDQKSGLIANWMNIKKKAASASKKLDKKTDSLTAVTSIFNFNANDIVEKGAGILIYVSILLIKVIFSAVYYGTYSIIGIWAALAVFPLFKNNFLSILKSVLYLMVTPILIALVLVFMNQAIMFVVDSDGFLSTVVEMSKFIVLLLVLFGTLKISSLVINGVGVESWAGSIGSALSIGLGYKLMSKAFDTTMNPLKEVSGSARSYAGQGASQLFQTAAKKLSLPGVSSNFQSSSLSQGSSNKWLSQSTEGAQQASQKEDNFNTSNNPQQRATLNDQGRSNLEVNNQSSNYSQSTQINNKNEGALKNSYSSSKMDTVSVNGQTNLEQNRSISISKGLFNTATSISNSPNIPPKTSNNGPNRAQNAQKSRVYDGKKSQKAPSNRSFNSKIRSKDE